MHIEKQETEITLQTVIGQAETGARRLVAVSVGNIRVADSLLVISSHLVRSTAWWELRDGGIGEVGCGNVVLLWWGAILHVDKVSWYSKERVMCIPKPANQVASAASDPGCAVSPTDEDKGSLQQHTVRFYWAFCFLCSE
jgi:hypothetical protein